MHGGSRADRSLYAVLGVKRSATTAEVRAAYLDQVRRFHPDKVQQLRGNTAALDLDSETRSNDAIHQINQAYVTLSDDALRSQYDRKLAAAATTNVHPRVSAAVDFDAFQPLQTSESNILFTYPCRCGSSYTIDEDQVHELVEFIGCSGCSEVIQIRYNTCEV